jgi:uncharacterized protein (UPF0332 family)
MTPEALDFLVAAEGSLADATSVLAINIPVQAARLAYYAQFHAAQALIFERTGKISKTHKGTATQFHKIARDEPDIPTELAGQLTGAYYYKDRADYHVGTSPPITPAQVQAAIATAQNFVAVVRQALASPPSPPAP